MECALCLRCARKKTLEEEASAVGKTDQAELRAS